MAKLINSTHFFMPMEKIPTGTAQQRHFNRRTGTTFPSASYVEAKKILKIALLPHVIAKPYQRAVYLDVEYRYETKEKKKHNQFKTTRPDGDNLLKVLKDCMIGKFFYDDSQVAVESISRYYVPKGQGGIFVRIGEFEGGAF